MDINSSLAQLAETVHNDFCSRAGYARKPPEELVIAIVQPESARAKTAEFYTAATGAPPPDDVLETLAHSSSVILTAPDSPKTIILIMPQLHPNAGTFAYDILRHLARIYLGYHKPAGNEHVTPYGLAGLSYFHSLKCEALLLKVYNERREPSYYLPAANNFLEELLTLIRESDALDGEIIWLASGLAAFALAVPDFKLTKLNTYRDIQIPGLSSVLRSLLNISAEFMCPDYTVREMDMEVCGNILCQLMDSIKSAF